MNILYYCYYHTPAALRMSSRVLVFNTDAEMKDSLLGALGCQRFLLSKSVAGQNIALHAAPADRASTQFLPSQFMPLRFSQAPPILGSRLSLCHERLVRIVDVHFVLP